MTRVAATPKPCSRWRGNPVLFAVESALTLPWNSCSFCRGIPVHFGVEYSIEIRDRRTQALLRTHPRAVKAGSLELPEDERPFNPSRQSAFLLASAGDIGPQTKALCQYMFDSEGRVGHRAMWGIVGLAKKYPARLVEQACDHALRHHVYRYKQVRAIVERLFEQALERLDQAPQLELPLTQDHPLIRPAAEYGELFALGAQHGAEPQPPTGETQT
ncbi:hypothetical protein OKW30_008373 [Paraburkholderia sp. Clong3]